MSKPTMIHVHVTSSYTFRIFSFNTYNAITS